MSFAWGLFSAALLCASAAGQDYPGKPIRLLIGFPTGGNVDVVGRIVAQKMSEGFGQQVLPENRTGAGALIANEHVAKSAADGYTLLVVSHLDLGDLSAGVLGALRLALPHPRRVHQVR